MALTTPPRPYDLLKDFPELASYAKPAVRLHPWPGNPTVEESSIGGPLLWPADEEWPMCGFEHAEFTVDPVDGTRVDEDPVPLIPVAQLFYRDVPGLPFADRFDLLQILWCPRDHVNTRNQPSYCPAFQVRWGRADTTDSVLAHPPQPDFAVDNYVPTACVVQPETVTEYPDIRTLPESLEQALSAWHRPEDEEEDDEWSTAYSFDTAHAPGWKVLGYGMYWGIFDPAPVMCDCGAEQLPLFTADTGENNGGRQSWQPLEEAGTQETYEGPVSVSIGRGYALQLFYCPESETHPCRAVMA
ncbi:MULTISPECIES: hypothetical protein [Glycomyces]|uniref:DUF1963 domain-containing protein n=2 Tax=Glycomyces TaxID=58113 RepID=A0A9X3TA09_9ACTN|nr:hypothetical protein [Glycomyces lechevalierae]MDA1387133.1 hypothetical protein [Glycomyces lechevalierae]MDR7336726.1 hypothetical protein [Glycomyces lechevalierae]